MISTNLRPVPDAHDHVSDDPSATPPPARRAPRFRPFAWSGVLLGFLAAVVIAQFADPTAAINRRSVVFYLSVVLCGLGALLGAATAVVLDRRSSAKVGSNRG